MSKHAELIAEVRKLAEDALYELRIEDELADGFRSRNGDLTLQVAISALNATLGALEAVHIEPRYTMREAGLLIADKLEQQGIYSGAAYLRDNLLTLPADETEEGVIVTTVERLDALPDRTVIIDKFGDVLQYRAGLWCGYETTPFGSERVMKKYGPVRIIDLPQGKA